MATLSSVIVPAKVLKGGRHKVRIALAHNGETRYILTDIIIDSAKEFKHGQIVRRADAALLNVKLRGLMQRCQAAIDELEYTSGLTCAELVYQLKHAGDTKHRTLQSLFEERMQVIKMKPKTQLIHRNAWKAIAKYVKPEMLAESVRASVVSHLETCLRNKSHHSEATICMYLNVFKAVVNYGIRAGYVHYQAHPFALHKMPDRIVRKAWLTAGQIKAIRDVPLTGPGQQRARDLFMLSFYLGGMNMADLVKYDFKAGGNVLKYIRTKTERQYKANKYVEFDIPDEAWPLIDRLTGEDGLLKGSATQRESLFSENFRLYLPRIAEKAGVPKFIFYSARKTFSQIAFDLGVSTAVIDYILGHKLNGYGTSLFSYIAVTPQMATDAVRKVLDSLK